MHKANSKPLGAGRGRESFDACHARSFGGAHAASLRQSSALSALQWWRLMSAAAVRRAR